MIIATQRIDGYLENFGCRCPGPDDVRVSRVPEYDEFPMTICGDECQADHSAGRCVVPYLAGHRAKAQERLRTTCRAAILAEMPLEDQIDALAGCHAQGLGPANVREVVERWRAQYAAAVQAVQAANSTEEIASVTLSIE